MTPEPELVEKIQGGDEDAFRELYDRYVRLVYHYVVIRVGNVHDAEDITAEVFIKAWRSFGSFKWQGKPVSGWLLRIAHNLVVDKYRQKRDLMSFLPWHRAQEDERLTRIEQRDEIQRGFATLPYEQQVILFLLFFENYSVSEVAEFLGKSANAIRVAQFRALKRLRVVLEDAEQPVAG